MAITFTTGEIRGLEKTAIYDFNDAPLPAGTVVKAEIGEEELDVTVPEGKVWYGRMRLFVRETDV